jgi:methylase of polypeptide subunit release factors
MRDSNAERAGSMQALVDLLRALRACDYAFVTVTPETHRRVLEQRPGAWASDLRDVFGWSLPFAEDALPRELVESLRAAGGLETVAAGFRSRFRVSTLHERLFLHSAYPTDTDAAVFFGPDSYRFADFIRADLLADPIQGPVLDIGAGSGVGAIVAARSAGDGHVVLTDINPAALHLARANAAYDGLAVEGVLTGDARQVEGRFAVIVANPPFIDDPKRLAYRHGGGLHGSKSALDWAAQALDKLAPGGRLLLYTGSAIVGGVDPVKAGLNALVREGPFRLVYREIDPDIFGEQISEPSYAVVDRIAAVGARIDRR